MVVAHQRDDLEQLRFVEVPSRSRPRLLRDSASVDEIVEGVREFVRKSPAVAIGAAAALGFVVARLFTAGLDQRGEG